MSPENEQEASTALVCAPFGTRLLAFLLDCLILILPISVIQQGLPYIGPLALYALYKAVFEASAAQATPGKRACDLIVVDDQQQRISFRTSCIRCVVSWGSMLCLGFGHLVALFSPTKQTLHDMLADTYVVRGRRKGSLWELWLEQLRSVFSNLKHLLGGRYSEMQKLRLLDKLNELRQNGALTEEEFQKRKATILKED